MQRLLLLGLNHATAPIEVREALAFSPEQQHQALQRLRDRYQTCEFVLLSTCNRVELYAARELHGHPRGDEMAQFLAEFHQAPLERFRAHLYHKSDREVVEHLFSVASSLDSMVLGETQILGQVRGAYDRARELSITGTMLNPLFQRAVAVAKQVMHDTPLNEGRLSIASVAVNYARRIFDGFEDKTVLCIGAGKMVRLVLRHFAQLKPGRVLICNRSREKADALAAEFGGAAAAFDALQEQLVAADIVISSTGSARPIITRDQMQHVLKARRYRPLFLIDIAVPRDVEPQVGELEHVFLCNIDELQRVVSKTQSQRTEAISAAKTIVNHSVDDFIAWHRARKLGPLIDELYKRSHALAMEELSRTLNKLPNVGEQEREHLEDLARRIVNKLLHEPVQTLHESSGVHAPVDRYAHALSKLFHLPEIDAPLDLNDAADAEN
jgi:glutamyl-tRNA reductase